jgi:hypothetical protein
MGYICVHGYFYPPPGENPSLEAIEVQDTAAIIRVFDEAFNKWTGASALPMA